MTGLLAARRRKRLIAKLNRAWWRTVGKSILAMRHRDPDHWYDLSEDLFAIVESLEAGDPVDAPFQQPPSPLVRVPDGWAPLSVREEGPEAAAAWQVRHAEWLDRLTAAELTRLTEGWDDDDRGSQTAHTPSL